ncbi:hypothetical protein ABZ511_24860 [Nocardia gamkensis]
MSTEAAENTSYGPASNAARAALIARPMSAREPATDPADRLP